MGPQPPSRAGPRCYRTAVTALLAILFCGAASAAAPRSAPVQKPAAAVVSAPVPLTAVGRGVEERRGVGLVVVDVKDSTPLHLNVGNRRGHALILGALDFAEASGSLFDGVVVRRLGDGHVMAFPTFEQAVQAAGAIQEHIDSWRRRVSAPALELRASAHVGKLIVDGSQGPLEVFGEPVERALQLAAAGSGRDVAVDPALAGHPAVSRLAARSQATSGPKALLLKPHAAKGHDLPGLQPPLTVSRMTAAATLFVGLSDFAGSYERYGKRAAYSTLKAFHAYARGIIEARGGRWVKSDGETVMASFESPADALEAAVELQRRVQDLRGAAPLGPLVALKAGLSYGRALRDERLEGADFYGNTVNASARFMRLAHPGEVLVGERVIPHAASNPELVGAPLEEVRLKGFAMALSAARLKPAAVPADPVAVARLKVEAEAARARVTRLP